MVLSPDGRWLAAEYYDAARRSPVRERLGRASGRLAQTLDARLDDVRALAFSGDGRRLAVVDPSGALMVFDVTTGGRVFSAKVRPAEARLAALSPDGGRMASAGAGSEVRLWDVAAGRQLGAVAAGSGVISALAFTPEGRLLIAGGDGAVEERDAGGR